MSTWIQALKEYNKDGMWCMPRKGTAEHAEVMKIMEKLKAHQKRIDISAPSKSNISNKAKVVTNSGKARQKRIDISAPSESNISKMEAPKRKLRKAVSKPNPFDKEKFLVSNENGVKEYAPLSKEEERTIVLPEGSLWYFFRSDTPKKRIYNIYEEQGHTLKLIMTQEISNVSVDDNDETFKLVKNGPETMYRVTRNINNGNIEAKIPFNGPLKPMVKLVNASGDVLRRINLVKTSGKNRKFGSDRDEPTN